MLMSSHRLLPTYLIQLHGCHRLSNRLSIQSPIG